MGKIEADRRRISLEVADEDKGYIALHYLIVGDDLADQRESDRVCFRHLEINAEPEIIAGAS